MSLRTMLTCHWAVRRIGRYLDDDPAAPLTAAEVRRLEGHLAACARCSGVRDEHRALHLAFSRWSREHLPDDASLARLRATLDQLIEEGRR